MKTLSKIKKLTSVLLAAALICTASAFSISASAATQADEEYINYGIDTENIHIPNLPGPFTDEEMAQRRQMLQDQIDIAEDDFYFPPYIHSKYTYESCESYFDTLCNARHLVADENADFNDMGAMFMELRYARAGLEPSESFVPKEALENVLAYICWDFDFTPEYWYDYYTKESYDNYVAVKQKAEKLLADENATDEECINMIEELKTARKARVKVQSTSDDEVDEEVTNAAYVLKNEAENICFKMSNYLDGGSWYPSWSPSTKERFNDFNDSLENKIYGTMEEVNADREKLDELKRTATISPSELEFVMGIFEKENNALGYYDEEIWNEFTSVYEECKQAAAGDDEEAVHIAYVKARNILNKLCLYNKTMGDVNNDGEVNVKDATLLQLAVVETVPLTLSQAFVCNYVENVNPSLVPDVKDVTELQKYIVEDESVTQFDSSLVTELEAYPEYELYPENRLTDFWDMDREEANYLYQCYFYDQFIYWL